MILLTAFYEDKNKNRQTEFLRCLEKNIQNEWFSEIHLFIEEFISREQLLASYPLLAHAKLCLINHERRVTYQDFLLYANRNLSGCQVAVANADIYFDETLASLDEYDLTGKLFCLTRWDIQDDGSACFFDHPGSQDAWLFQAPFQKFPCDFYLGILGCDNRLAWEAANVGLEVSNPSRSIHVFHLHLSQVHRYNSRQFMQGPVAEVVPGYLEMVNLQKTNEQQTPVYALTSIPPSPKMMPRIQACIRSWRNVGLEVRAFNHP